jgi:hypothetical protein
MVTILQQHIRGTLKFILIMLLYMIIYLTDQRLEPNNLVEMAVAGAHRNLKLSEYYVLGSHSQI